MLLQSAVVNKQDRSENNPWLFVFKEAKDESWHYEVNLPLGSSIRQLSGQLFS